MKAKCLLVVMVILFITGILVSPSPAKIDLESIMGVWLFEGKGDTVKDSSGNGNDGKIIDAKRVAGKQGEGIEFDGSNHVRIPASATIDDFLNGFTYLLWTKPLTPPSGPHVRLIERDWHNPNILIGPAPDFYGSFLFNGAINSSQIRGGNWKLGQWSFVALTYNEKTLILYVDGKKVSDIKVGKPEFTQKHDGGSIWLAKWKGGPGWDFKGVLDEVAIFNVPLTEDELNTIMLSGLEKTLAVSPTGKLATAWGVIKSNN